MKDEKLSVTYPGKVAAASNVKLAFRVAGPIKTMKVNSGQYVKKGQLLAEIDPRDYLIQFNATQAEYNQIKGESDRVIELYQRGSVSVNEYDKAVSAKKRVTALYQAHRNALKDTRLLAPFDGYIQKKYFDTDETVAAGMPVISMIDTRYFEVEIDVPSSDYVRRHLFNRFTAVADVFPDRVFPLELIDVTKKANLNQLYQMRLRLTPDPAIPLAAGMSVNVTIDYEAGGDNLTVVPLSAIFQDKEKSSVWVYRPADKKVTQRQVKIRQILKEGRVVLDEGLQSGEIVVTAGVHKLKEGMEVERLKPVADTNIGGLL